MTGATDLRTQYRTQLQALLTADDPALQDELADELHQLYLEGLAAGTFAATTPGGLPYPLPTDPVAAGANNIRALAEALDPTRYAGLAVQNAGVTYNTLSQVGWSSIPLARGLTGAGAGLTVSVGGWWELSYAVNWAGQGTANAWARAIASINGSTQLATDSRVMLSGASNMGLRLGGYPLLLAAGDVVGLQLAASTATATANAVWMALRYLTPTAV